MIMDLLKDLEDDTARYFLPTVYIFQVSMIDRINDSAKFLLTISCVIFNMMSVVFLQDCIDLKCTNRRRRVEPSASWNIVPHYCVLLGLSTWIDYSGHLE